MLDNHIHISQMKSVVLKISKVAFILYSGTQWAAEKPYCDTNPRILAHNVHNNVHLVNDKLCMKEKVMIGLVFSLVLGIGTLLLDTAL